MSDVVWQGWKRTKCHGKFEQWEKANLIAHNQSPHSGGPIILRNNQFPRESSYLIELGTFADWESALVSGDAYLTTLDCTS